MITMDKDSAFSEESQALMISEALQIILQLKRLHNGRRIVSRITGVNGINENKRVALVDIYTFNRDTDQLECTWRIPENIAECFKNREIPLDPRFEIVKAQN